MIRNRLAAALVFALISTGPLVAQTPSDEQTPPDQVSQNSQKPAPAPAPAKDGSAATAGGSSTATNAPSDPFYAQSNRILGIIPNFRAVSADTQLPPLSVKGKFALAAKGNFDYTAFLTVGIEAGFSQATDGHSYFGQGAKGYGRRYWHLYADAVIGNFFTNAIIPSVTHEDPRYYTLGHGGPLRRTGYALSRVFVTKSDAGNWTFNISEITGNGIGAAISNLYYPSSQRTWTNTYQRWTYQMGADALGNVLREFWPDIASMLKRPKKGTLQGQNHP